MTYAFVVRATARVLRALVAGVDPPKQTTVWQKAKIDSGHFSRLHSGEEIPKEEAVTKIARAFPQVATELLRAWAEDCRAELHATIGRVFNDLSIEMAPNEPAAGASEVARIADETLSKLAPTSQMHFGALLSSLRELAHLGARADAIIFSHLAGLAAYAAHEARKRPNHASTRQSTPPEEALG